MKMIVTGPKAKLDVIKNRFCSFGVKFESDKTEGESLGSSSDSEKDSLIENLKSQLSTLSARNEELEALQIPNDDKSESQENTEVKEPIEGKSSGSTESTESDFPVEKSKSKAKGKK